MSALKVPAMFLASAEVDRAMQRFQAAQPDNSHPVVAAKQDVRKAQAQRRGTASGSKPASGGRVSVNPAVPDAPEVSAAPTPKSPLAGLPGAGSTPKVQVTTDGDIKKITDGLGDTVETILPDPGTGAGGLLP